MQPQNSNQNQNPNQTPQPGQPGQAPFQRRPIQQPIAPRPFATPAAQPQARPQPQQFVPPAPQPIKPQTAQSPVDQFGRPAQPQAPSPAPPQQFATSQFRPASRPVTQPNDFNAPRSAQSPTSPVRLDEPLDLDLNHDAFPRFEKPESAKKTGLPKGVIAVIVIAAAGLGVGLIDKSQHNMLFTTVLAFDLLLAVGLFVRKEIVHKAAVGFAIATVTVSAALALGYRGVVDNSVNAEALFIAEAQKLQNQSPTKQLTHQQQQHLDAMQLQLEAQKNAVGENSTLVYGKYGATVVLYALVALYLTRPKVKEAFAETVK
jgi:hypothetical protein